ncbi:linker for activation of T-cells family member 1 [Amia ocellicauda]|uniref:linker for activation of T-cells family member 1 n=1 Tax=Amia ocellicauda TaxID=2972642 RepID=UPI0034647BED
MESAALGSYLLGAVYLVPAVLVTALCMGCWRQKNNARIPQNIADYEDELPFRVVRPSTSVTMQMNHKPGPAPPPSTSFLLPVMSPHIVESRRTSFAPTEDNESVPSYENEEHAESGDYVNEEEEKPGEGYIEVLPDPPAPVVGSVSQQSLLSTPSSVNENYVNVDDTSENFDSNSGNYVNLDEENCKAFTLNNGLSFDNVHDSEDDESSDYVNAPHIAH